MGLHNSLISQLNKEFSSGDLEKIFTDLGLDQSLVKDRAVGLLIAVRKNGRFESFSRYLRRMRPDRKWPSGRDLTALPWEQLINRPTPPPSPVRPSLQPSQPIPIHQEMEVGDIGRQATVAQGDQAQALSEKAVSIEGDIGDESLVVTGDGTVKVAKTIINNINHVYPTGRRTNALSKIIEQLGEQLRFTQLLYFAVTGAFAFLGLEMMIDQWIRDMTGPGTLLIFVLFLAIGLAPGAAYGFILTYIGDARFKERYSYRFLALNVGVFGLSFMLAATTHNTSGPWSGVFGLIVGIVFGVAFTIPWWTGRVTDRIFRVVLTIILCIILPFLVDLLFNFPLTTLAGRDELTRADKWRTALVLWIIFGGSLSFYFSVWPQDIAALFTQTEEE